MYEEREQAIVMDEEKEQAITMVRMRRENKLL